MCFEECLFWGKIEGCLTDYYIAVGINYLGHENFAQKSYFWCTGDCKKFSKLPECIRSCSSLFD